jgi:Domain of unknown function (DUF4153)
MFVASRFRTVIRPDLITAARRFPVPVGAAIMATCVAILWIENVIPKDSDLYKRLYFAAATAFATGVAGRIASDSRAGWTPAILSHLIPIVLGTIAGLSLFNLWMTPAMVLASLALIVIAAPGLSPGGTPIRFWVFNTRSVFAGLVGAVGGGIFVLGLWCILMTLKSLFDLQVSDRPISYAMAVGFNLTLPLYWLALLPKVSDIEDKEPPPDVLLRAIAALTDFIFIPLLAVYAVILHIYAAKIALEGMLPRGQIGWMASVFLGLGYLTFLLAFPERSPLPRLRRVFRFLWPPAALVPAGLLALALERRVAAYGITEDRYLTGLAALAAILLFLTWLVRRRIDIRIVPALAAGLLLVGAVGPYAAKLMTVHSQAQRFVDVLEASGELKGGRFDGVRSTPWGYETTKDLRSIVHLLEARRALYLIAPTIGEEVASSAEIITAYLRLDRNTPVQPTIASYARIEDAVLTNIFHWYSATSALDRSVIFRDSGAPEYLLKIGNRSAILSGLDETFTFDLSAEMEWQSESPKSDLRVVQATSGNATLILRELRWKRAGETLSIQHLSGQILIRTGSGRR